MRSTLQAAILFACSIGGCSTELLVGAPCPCATGWVCCSDVDVCVRQGSKCPAPASLSHATDGAISSAEPIEQRLDASAGALDAAPAVPDAKPTFDATRAAAAPDSSQLDASMWDAGSISRAEACDGRRWCWSLPQVTGDGYVGIWGTSPLDLWLATDSGSVLHHDGTRFARVYQAPESVLSGTMWGRAADDVWFAFNTARGARFVRWDGRGFDAPDYGESTTSPPHTFALGGTSDSVWSVGAQGSVFRWYRRTRFYYDPPRSMALDLPVTRSLRAVWAADDQHVWVMDEQGTPYVSDFANQRWTPHGDPALDPQQTDASDIGLWGSGPDDVWAIHEEHEASGQRSVVFRHFDGQTWTRSADSSCANTAPYPGSPGVRRVWGQSASDVWVTGNYCACTWHWDGNVWERRAPIEAALTRYDARVDQTLWSDGNATVAAGPGGALARYQTDATWHRWIERGPRDVFSVSALDDADIYAVADSRVRHFDGKDWRELPPIPASGALGNMAISVHANATNDVWCSAASFQWTSTTGLLAHWDGTRWDRVVEQPEAGELIGTRAHGLWLRDNDGTRQWDGQALAPPPLARPVDRVAGSATDLWLASTDETGKAALFHAQPGGAVRLSLPAAVASIGGMSAIQQELWLWPQGGSASVWHWHQNHWQEVDLPTLVQALVAWGTSADDVWFAGQDAFARPLVWYWDGVALRKDGEGLPGRGVNGISGTERNVYLATNGVLRGAR